MPRPVPPSSTPGASSTASARRWSSPHLADFLERVAAEGSDALFRGDVARVLIEDMAANGGLITQADLDAYRTLVRPSATVQVADWTIATNPPPAIGGPVLAAMLILLDGHPADKWSDDDLVRWVAVQRAVLRHRAAELDVASDRARAGQALLDGVLAGGQKWLGVAPSTAHVSVVDAEGFACSVTASSGYGAGVTIPGTGVWLNNCLGEHELNRAGLHTLAPGERLASNMAPSVARRPDGSVLAIGSPGADRITSALAQVLASFAHGGYDLQQAIDRPRVHLSRAADGTEVLHQEDDVVLPATLDLPIKKYPPQGHVHGRGRRGAARGRRDPRRRRRPAPQRRRRARLTPFRDQEVLGIKEFWGTQSLQAVSAIPDRWAWCPERDSGTSSSVAAVGSVPCRSSRSASPSSPATASAPRSSPRA